MSKSAALLCFVFALGPLSARAQWVRTSMTDRGDVFGLAVMGDHVLAGSILGDVSYSTDDGSSWWSSDFPNSSFYVSITFTPNGSEIFAASNGEDQFGDGPVGQGVFVSLDSGMHWMARDNGLTNWNVVGLATIGTNLFAASSYWVNTSSFTFHSCFYRSTDSGQSWTASNNGLPPTRGINTLVRMNTDLFLGGTDSVYRSMDEGVTWKSVSRESATCFAVLGNTIFAGTQDSGISRSTDRGAHWSAVNIGIPLNVHTSVGSLAANGSLLFAAVVTTDSGKAYRNVFLSSDSGANWSQKKAGLAVDNILSWALSDRYLFAGTAKSGVWRRTLADMNGFDAIHSTGVSSEKSMHVSIIGNRLLAQFDGSPIEIQIVNLLGTEVFSKHGTGEINLDLESLPAGVYFAIVQGNGTRDVRRVLVTH